MTSQSSRFSNVAHKTLEGQIAAQQDRLVRQAAEIQELSNTLNEALHKVRSFRSAELCIHVT